MIPSGHFFAVQKPEEGVTFGSVVRKKLFQATTGHISERNFAPASSSVIPSTGRIGK